MCPAVVVGADVRASVGRGGGGQTYRAVVVAQPCEDLLDRGRVVADEVAVAGLNYNKQVAASREQSKYSHLEISISD